MTSEQKPHQDSSDSNPGDNPQEPSKELLEFVEGLPEAQAKEELLQAIRLQITSGPLPPPDDFEKYNKILPNAAERILGMAERNLEIRIEETKGNIRNDRIKIIGAILLGVLLIVIAGIMGWTGNNVAAVPFGIAGIVFSFLRRMFQKNQKTQ